MTTIYSPGSLLLCIPFAMACTMGAAQAGTSSAIAQAQARYRADMAFCSSGQSSQHINVCRMEARNAFAEAKRGGLNDAPGAYARNAIRRCEVFQGGERSDCETLVRNPTHVKGSVEGGGLLRESVTVTPVE